MAGRDDPQQFGEWIADVERPENHAVKDGTSNTLMIGEVIHDAPMVAMQTITIAHEGFELM
jgi:hypothetical protein